MKSKIALLVVLAAGLVWLAIVGSPASTATGLAPAGLPASAVERSPEAESVVQELGNTNSAPALARTALDDTAAALGKRELRGQVVVEGGQAISGVSLTLFRQQGDRMEDGKLLDRAASATDGRFTLRYPDTDGDHYLAAQVRGFRDVLMPVRDQDEILVVLGTCRPRVTVIGRVVGSGHILPRFVMRDQVLIEDTAGLRSEERWLSVEQVGGGFSVSMATLGSQDIQVAIRAPGFLDHIRSLTLTEDSTVDVGTIELQPSTMLRGYVSDLSGAPIGNAAVFSLLEQGVRGLEVKSSPVDGSFEIASKEGQVPVALFATANRYAPRLMQIEEAGGFWDGVVILLEPGSRLEGRITLASGQPVADVRVQAWLGQVTGSELPGGGMGSGTWVRSTKSNSDGDYTFENVPRGQLMIGVSRGSPDGSSRFQRILRVSIAETAAYRCDFTLGDGRTVRGAFEFPIALDHPTLWLELFAGEDGQRVPVASMETPPTEPFAFEDVPTEHFGRALVLRISVAPGFYVERQVVARADDGSLGTVRFEGLESLYEFNRGEKRVFWFERER